MMPESKNFFLEQVDQPDWRSASIERRTARRRACKDACRGRRKASQAKPRFLTSIAAAKGEKYATPEQCFSHHSLREFDWCLVHSIFLKDYLEIFASFCTSCNITKRNSSR